MIIKKAIEVRGKTVLRGIYLSLLFASEIKGIGSEEWRTSFRFPFEVSPETKA